MKQGAINKLLIGALKRLRDVWDISSEEPARFPETESKPRAEGASLSEDDRHAEDFGHRLSIVLRQIGTKMRPPWSA